MRKIKKILHILFLFLTIISYCFAQTQPVYKNTSLSVTERVADLVSQMTVEEKISQMSHLAPGIERLDIIPYEPNFENTLLEGTYPTIAYGVIISAAFFEKDVKKLVQMAIEAVPNNLIFENKNKVI